MDINSVSTQAYQRMSSGLKINSAADDAAGLSISQGMESQINGLEQNQNNIGSMTDLANTAEGALGSIQDNLGRIRELAVQASNGILTDDDRSAIQTEIDGLLENINDVAKNTQYNSIKVLDGTFADMNTAMNPDGTGKQMSIESAALDNLGLSGFDVTGSFDIEAIDNAIEMVSDSRSSLGSAVNAFEYASNDIGNRMTNLTSAQSQIQDADLAETSTQLRKQQVLQQYQFFAMKAKEEQMRTELGPVQEYKV